MCARADDGATLRWLTPLDDRSTRLAVAAERSLLRRLEGGCQVPLGALARLGEGTLTLDACVCALDGSRHLSARGTAAATSAAGVAPEEAVALGTRVAEELLARGAGELIAHERNARAVEAP